MLAWQIAKICNQRIVCEPKFSSNFHLMYINLNSIINYQFTSSGSEHTQDDAQNFMPHRNTKPTIRTSKTRGKMDLVNERQNFQLYVCKHD